VTVAANAQVSQKRSGLPRVSRLMRCAHDGFHAILSVYDRSGGLLLYFWICERCGARLGEAGSQEYRPSFDPRGNDTILRPAAR
jgi:hypothetical protein